MDPKHTLLFHDMRPFKAAMLHLIAEVDAGRLSPDDAQLQTKTLASHVPGLDEAKYSLAIGRLLVMRMPERAIRLVACLDDWTLRPWVFKWSFVLGAIALVVWLVVR